MSTSTSPPSSSPPPPPSPSLHSVSSSDPKFSTKSLMLPETPHATILSSKPPSSSNNIVAKHNNRTRRRSTSDVRNSSTNNHHHHPSSYDLIDEPWVSPYYKGLTDQSLAINNNNEESLSQNHHHHHQIQHQSTLISSPSSAPSPYYKGLTDFSLVLHAVAAAAPHGGDLNEAAAEGGHECSPYYRGLTDFSLAIGKHEGGGSYRYSIGSSILGTCNFNYLGLCLGWNEQIIDFNQPPQTTTTTLLSTAPQTLTPKGNKTELNSVEMEVEEKRLGETVILSELENKREEENNNNNENEKEKMMMKSLRESVTNTITDHKQTVFAISESSDHHDQCSGKDGDVADIDVITEKMKLIAEEEEEESVKEYVWANKYQPKALAHFICHKNIVAQLQEMIKEGCACNHFIFEGPPGVGKRSMIRALLREVFGHEGVEVTEEYKTFNLKGEMVGSIQVRIKKSEHHVEVTLSETKGYEQHVIVDLFRETYEKTTPNPFPCVPDNCQAIVIYEAEKLSTESLLYIKWMLERHKGCNKVFFCCSDETKLQIVKPLCSTLRLSSPSSQEIVEVLEYIGKEEGKEVTMGFLRKVVEKSKNNLRQAIRSLEATCHNKDSIKEDELILTGWEDDISNIAKKIIKQQSPKQLYIIHLRLQSLMIHNVSPYFVYKYLVSELNSLVDDSLRPEVAKLDKEYNNNVYKIKLKNVKQTGHAQNKEGESDEKNNELPKKNAHSYLKIEEFIAKFMSWYKNINASSSRDAHNDLGA